MSLMSLFRPAWPAGPARARISAVEWCDVSPASFRWTDGCLALDFAVQISSLRNENGIALAELKVTDHGLQVVCVLEGSKEDAVLYLGNWFIVPAALRRRGLARAVLTACLQAFHQAAFGRVLDAQRVRLQGYFVGDGEMFARATCFGELPTKAKPARLDVLQLRRATRQLLLVKPPLPLI
ncbi:MAG: hypothetical protein ACKOF9_09675 [Burkholderiales bacterium]